MPDIPSDPTSAELSRLRSGIRIMAMHDLRDPDLAEEVAQDTMVRLVQALREGRLQDPARLGAFTRAIARHVIVDTLRARQRLAATGTTEEPAGDEDSLGSLVSAEQAARVRSALEQLSAGDREILVDIHAHEPHTTVPLGCECPQVRLDGLARLAPGSPEIDDDGDGRCEHFLAEGLVRDVVHD